MGNRRVDALRGGPEACSRESSIPPLHARALGRSSPCTQQHWHSSEHFRRQRTDYTKAKQYALRSCHEEQPVRTSQAPKCAGCQKQRRLKQAGTRVWNPGARPLQARTHALSTPTSQTQSRGSLLPAAESLFAAKPPAPDRLCATTQVAWMLRATDFAACHSAHRNTLSDALTKLCLCLCTRLRRLLYGLWEYVFRREVYSVLILGVDKAGKTNVLERLKTIYTPLVGLDPGKILPTVGLNVGRLDALSQSMVFWDLGGQSGIRPLWDKYYDDSHAVIYVVDSASKERFTESRRVLQEVLANPLLHQAPVLVLANKQDLPGAADSQEVTEMFGLGSVTDRAVRVIPVCAYTGQGLRESVEWIIGAIRSSSRTQRLRVKANR